MPMVTSVRGSGLSWNDVATYYGTDLATLAASAGISGAQLRRLMSREGNNPIPPGITFRVPNVRDAEGQRRGAQNVFENRDYIERRTSAYYGVPSTITGGATSGSAFDDPPPAAGPDHSGQTTILLPPGAPGGGGSGGGGGGGGGGGTGGGGSAPDPSAMTEVEVGNALSEAMAAFPWLANLGAEVTTLIDTLVREGRSTDFILSRIRATGGYQTMFPNIRRPDGTMRLNEGQFMNQMDSYRAVMNQYGMTDYDNAALSNFLASDVDVNELNQRLRTWDAVQRGGGDLRTAFYVYAGISLSDSDLYDYMVDPVDRGNMDAQYAAAQAAGLDYNTFLQRTAEIAAINTGVQVDPQTNMALVDQLLHGGNPTSGQYLSLSELMNAYEAAMIGSAATSVGLRLADISRIEEFRQVGITHAQARQGYGQFARDQAFLNAVVERARVQNFGQTDFEDASFLSDPDAQRNLTRGMAQEEARSKGAGSFAFGQEAGRLNQSGLSALRN